jgi:hypothetical protein
MIYRLFLDYLNLNIQIYTYIYFRKLILPNINDPIKPRIIVRKTPFKAYHITDIE